MNKSILYGLLIVMAFALGMLTFSKWTENRDKQIRQQQATVLMERVREVCKLVTVEGDVSELYNETMTRQVTMYLPLPTKFNFDKKATVQVEGTVLVGYDLEQVNFDLNVNEAVLTISNFPEPKILAIDHDIKYRDLSESWFNGFSPEDYTELNRSAKEFLREKAAESELMDKAREQGLGIIDNIRQLVEAAGIQVIVEQQLPTAAAPLG
ncbi:MAG: DUF4230 domain-containing protein [Bacteroidota bacterium]